MYQDVINLFYRDVIEFGVLLIKVVLQLQKLWFIFLYSLLVIPGKYVKNVGKLLGTKKVM